MFHVGDVVVGNHPTYYSCTKLGWVGIVIDVFDDGYMKVAGEDDYGNHATFRVQQTLFDLCSQQPLFDLCSQQISEDQSEELDGFFSELCSEVIA